MRKIWFLGFGCFLWCNVLIGQQIYEVINTGTSTIWLLDAGNCTRTEVVSNISPDIDDFVEIPGGSFFMVNSPIVARPTSIQLIRRAVQRRCFYRFRSLPAVARAACFW
jgi:hypothetical protein